MIELVADEGYEALTIRSLAKRARISSGAIYSHYRSTDDCFLSTYDLIFQRAAERMMEAARGGPNPRQRLELAIDRLLRDIAAFPQTATFALRAAPAAGPAFTGRLRNSAMRLGITLEYCLGGGDGRLLPTFLLEGVVAGLTRIGRVSVPAAGAEGTATVAADTVEWILSLCVPAEAAERLAVVAPPDRESGPRAEAPPSNGCFIKPLGDERAMILAAAFRVARSGYHQLSVPRICREAGVSRRTFDRHFRSIEDCFFSAVEERVSRAVAASARRPREPVSWSAAVYEVLETLCNAVEADIDSAGVLFDEIVAAGPQAIDVRDRLISQVARALRTSAPRSGKPSELAAEASSMAVWAVLRSRVTEQGDAAAPALPSIAFLMLAPAISAPAALEAIGGTDKASPGDKRRISQLLDFR